MEWEFPDIAALFCYYNELYFGGRLGACSVQWSTPRMTLCAGICKYSVAGGCEIRLSEPLLKYRPVSDFKNTLLHEMIHAYLFLTDGNKDHDDHGRYFLAKMKEINDSKVADFERPVEGYHITVYHNFVDEVNNYRVHHWKCQSCGNMVKRAMNRPPSPADCIARVKFGTCSHPRCSWHSHANSCGGSYLKVSEPPDYQDRRQKKAKASNSRLAPGSSSKSSSSSKQERAENVTLDKFFTGQGKLEKPDKVIDLTGAEDLAAAKEGRTGLVTGQRKLDKPVNVIDLTGAAVQEGPFIKCPVCNKSFIGDVSSPSFNSQVNQHLDQCLNQRLPA